jgi:PII-like signaling protein
MNIPEDAQLLRIFIGESDRWEGAPLYEALVRKAKADGLAGATVLRGNMGFGANSRIHSASILRLSEDLPVVVEIVDATDKIIRFASEVDAMIGDGLVTLEKVRVVHYRHRK